MQYFSQITGIRETEKGTDLLLHIPGEMVQREITKYRNGAVINSEIRIDDNRSITSDQRKKIFATIKDISIFTGDHPEDIRSFLLYDYCIETGEMPFSLSDCSISQAREYITFIIDFILKHGIPLSDKALNRTDDIDRYLWGCVKFRRCCITGLKGDLHHCTGSRVGMGSNRNKVSHSNRSFICLSRKYHDILHDIGENDFFEKYKVYGIKIDDVTLKELGYKVDEEMDK